MPSSTGRYVLLATILASSMAFIDGSALNVVLPSLQRDLGAGGGQLVWIVNGYLLMLASLILIGGSLGDQYGRNRIFGAGIVLFTLASAACGFAPSAEVLILGRVVQGIGGALMVPGSLAIITASFPPDQRGQAIGVWSSVSTITTLGGPILGGLLADSGLWRWVFFINLPLAAVALWALRRVPETRRPDADRTIDLIGAFLITLGLAGLTYGLVTWGERAGAAFDLGIGLAIGGGLVALAAFVGWEARSPHPMIDLRLFRSRAFTGTNLMTAFLYGALSGGLFFLPLLLIQVHGYSGTEASAALLPFALILAALSPWAGRWGARVGPRLPLTIGPAVVGMGFLALGAPALTDGFGQYWTSFFGGVVLIGVGMGITVAPLTATVMSAAPESSAGVASGVNNAVTRSAQALMTAIFGALALIVFTGALQAALTAADVPSAAQTAMLAEADQLAQTPVPLGAGLTTAQAEAASLAIREAFAGTFRLLMGVAAALCAVSAGVSAWVLRPTRPPTA
ncbi:MAG: MFS transporter [Anaerolineae bacterium]|nr:MFS transporter [Anaerolineae bacterium]